MQADRLPGDVDGRRRGNVQDSLGRLSVPVRHGTRRAGGDGGPAGSAGVGVAGGKVSGLRDGAMSLALLDERLVGGTGTAEDDKSIKVGSMSQTWLKDQIDNSQSRSPPK